MSICDKCANKIICRFAGVVAQFEEKLEQEMASYEISNSDFYYRDILSIKCSKMKTYKVEENIETNWYCGVKNVKELKNET